MKLRTFLTETTQRVQVWSGATIPVLHNPSRTAFEKFVQQYEVLRGLLSQDGREVWLWYARAAVHPNLIQALGLPNVDCIAYDSRKPYASARWTGPVNTASWAEYVPAIQRLTPKEVKHDKAADDELLRQLLGSAENEGHPRRESRTVPGADPGVPPGNSRTHRGDHERLERQIR